MDLNGNDAAQRDALIRLRIVHRLNPVEPDLNASAFGTDPVTVPLTKRLARFLKHFLRWQCQHLVPAALVIERPVVTRPEVRLIPGDLVIIRDPLRPKLHPPVHKPFRPDQLPTDAEVEIPELPLRGKKLIARLLPIHAARREHILLNPPRPFRVSLPAIERPIKQRIRPAARAAGKEQKNKKTHGENR